MKRMTKVLALVLVVAIAATAAVLLLRGKRQPTVGILQYVQHPALDAAREGFLKALEDEGYVAGKNIRIDYQNGQGSQDTCSSIADKFIADKVDLVLGIATPSVLAMAGKTETIPILGTAVTDYVEAKLVQSKEAPGYNVSGTTDMNPVEAQVAMILRLVPDVRTVGVIYTASEVNSQLQARLAKAEIERLGLSWTEITINNSNDVQQAMTDIVGKCDALYIPTDNVLASAMPIVYEAALSAKVPVVAGDGNMVLQGGNFTLAIDYGKLGYQTGIMAVAVLRDGAKVSQMPIQSQSEFNYYINKTANDAMGIAITDDLMPYATEMKSL